MAPVQNQYVEWLVDSFADAADNAILEGIAFTAFSLTVPTRAANIVQRVYKSGEVTDTQRNILHAGFDDPVVYQEYKQVVSIKKDMELAIVKGSAATGTTGTANRMNGFMGFASMNKTDLSGVTLTETVFGDVLELIWDNGRAWPSEAFMGAKLKRTISGYSTKVTPFLDADEKKQVLTTDFYVSDFGRVNLHLHRDLLSQSGDAANEVLVIDPSYFRTGWLQPLRSKVIPHQGGLTTKWEMSASFTVLHRHEAGCAAVTDCRPYITS